MTFGSYSSIFIATNQTRITMKRSITALLFTLIISFGTAQNFHSFINYINGLPEPDRQTAVDSFMVVLEPYGFPYIHVDTACFIYQGAANSVNLAGDINDWSPSSINMTKIVATDFWYYYQIFEMNARLDYKFVLNGSNWILDPLNPNTVTGGYGPNSELAMPEYIQPWEIEVIPGTPSGAIETFSLNSTNTGTTFQVKVYMPYNYNPGRDEAYPTAYFHDGYEYITLGSADIVLNNLINTNILDNIIVVFVKPNNRNEEYAGSLRNQYRMFIVEELVPYIDNNYNTISEAVGRAVCGTSFGGNISTLIAYNHPDVFGNCGLHSAAFWPNNYEAYNLVINGPVEDIRWASLWGTYEGLFENMREFRDYLLSNAYELAWLELPEGHSWGLWRATIDELLPFFFPGNPEGVSEYHEHLVSDLRANPNPFSTSTTIEYKLNHPEKVRINFYNQFGKQVDIIEETQHIGLNKVVWTPKKLSDWIYYFRLQAGDQVVSGKMVLMY